MVTCYDKHCSLQVTAPCEGAAAVSSAFAWSSAQDCNFCPFSPQSDLFLPKGCNTSVSVDGPLPLPVFSLLDRFGSMGMQQGLRAADAVWHAAATQAAAHGRRMDTKRLLVTWRRGDTQQPRSRIAHLGTPSCFKNRQIQARQGEIKIPHEFRLARVAAL